MSSVSPPHRETEPPAPAAPDPGRRRLQFAMTALVGVLAVAALSIGAGGGPLTPVKALVLGAVEGLTEYLPVSSTGHLLVVERLLGLGTGSGKTAADTYAVAIQLGAIAAVVALYRRRLVQLVYGLLGRDPDGRRLLVRLVVAFLPAAMIGVVLGDTIKEHLFGPWPVVAAWTVGGLFLLVWRPRYGQTDLESFTIRFAVIIGCAEVLALWPGVSRSLVTIAAAVAVGASMPAAVEFSFLLGLATLSAATGLDLAKDGPTLVRDYGLRAPLAGALVAFVTAMFAVRWLVTFLRDHPLSVFGWYRLAMAALTVLLIVTGAV